MRPRHAIPLLAAALLAPPAAAQAKPGDRNHDRIPDKWEKAHGVSLAKPGAAKRDADGDGLTAWAEWRSATDPRKENSDGDKLPDGAEDHDKDGLANAFELAAGTDPGTRDSDHDRVRDGAEDPDHDHLSDAAEAKFGYLPLKRDSDDDGVADDAENPGVVSAVSGKRITIKLAGGGRLVAKLGGDAALACDARLAPVGAGILGDLGTDDVAGDPAPAPDGAGTGTEDLGYSDDPQLADPTATLSQSADDPPLDDPPPPPDDGSGDVPVDDGGGDVPIDDGSGDFPLDDGSGEDGSGDGSVPEVDQSECLPAVKKGALVRGATVQRADTGTGLAFVTLELLARSKPAKHS